VEDDASQPAITPTEDLASEDEGAPVPPSPPAPHVLVELPTEPSEMEPLRIDTPLPSLEHQRKCSGPPNLQATVHTNIAPPSPSALATSRYIDDIDLITYPQGIKRPSVELNVNTEKGKFRYVSRFMSLRIYS
jgi:translation initiation factor 4G